MLWSIRNNDLPCSKLTHSCLGQLIRASQSPDAVLYVINCDGIEEVVTGICTWDKDKVYRVHQESTEFIEVMAAELYKMGVRDPRSLATRLNRTGLFALAKPPR